MSIRVRVTGYVDIPDNLTSRFDVAKDGKLTQWGRMFVEDHMVNEMTHVHLAVEYSVSDDPVFETNDPRWAQILS